MSTDPSARSKEDELLDALWVRRHHALNKAWVQVRYHKRRQRFFDLVDKLTKSTTVVFGAAAMGRFLNEGFPVLPAAITSLGLLALVFGYGDRKQQHKEIAERAADIVASIEQVPVGQMTPLICAGWSADVARLSAKAPPPLKTLTILCEREQAIVEGHPDHVPEPWFYKRWIADFF